MREAGLAARITFLRIHFIKHEHRKPDIVLVDKVQQKCLIIDVACPGDNRIAEKEEEKLQRYDLLKREIKRLWRMKNIDIIPIIVGALGSINQTEKKNRATEY